MSSGGYPVAALEGGDAAVGVWAVAIGDVVSERALGVGPVEVVGVVEDELLDRAEVALDPVQVAGVGRGRDQLDPVGGSERTDVGRPVGREVVLDPVESAGGLGSRAGSCA
jgi:hypothetical protein